MVMTPDNIEKFAGLRVMTPDNIEKFAGLNIIRDKSVKSTFLAIYGPGGSGKTTVCSNVVHSEYGTPALLVSGDGSYSSVVHLIDKGLEIVQPEKWSDILKIKRQIERDDHQYKSIIWDNISEILALCVKHHAPTGMPEGQAALKTWGQITAAMMEFVREVRTTGIVQELNTLMTLWEETEKDPLTERVRTKVLLTPKFGAAFPGMATMVGRLTVVGKAKNNYVRKLSFVPQEDTDSKFRVSPTESAASIPLELWLKQDETFLADFIATVRSGDKFPVGKYGKPTD